jgi:hypothetical protein
MRANLSARDRARGACGVENSLQSGLHLRKSANLEARDEGKRPQVIASKLNRPTGRHCRRGFCKRKRET